MRPLLQQIRQWRVRPVTLMLAILFAGGIGGTWWYRRAHEPYCLGKPLRVWMEELDAANRQSLAAPWDELLKKGEAALPILLARAERRPSYLRLKYNGWRIRNRSRIPAWLARRLPAVDYSYGINRMQAVHFISAIRPPSTNALPTLIRLIEENDGEANLVKREVIECLGKMESQAAPALPLLLKLLQDTNQSFLFIDACDAIASIGYTNRPVVEAMLHACQSSNSNLRDTALRHLGSIYRDMRQPAALRDAFTALTRDPSAEVRLNATRYLGKTVPRDSQLTKALQSACEDKDARVREAASEALIDYARQDRAVLETLDALTHCREIDVRMNVAAALWNLDQRTNAYVRVLGEAVASPDAWQQRQAILRLGKVAGIDVRVPELIAAGLKSKESNIRKLAAVALGMIGPPARQVSKDLQLAVSDDSQEVSEAARRALKKIEAPTANPPP